MQAPKPHGGLTPERSISLLDELAANATGSRLDHFNWQNALKCFMATANKATELSARNAELEAALKKVGERNAELEAELEAFRAEAASDTVVDGPREPLQDDVEPAAESDSRLEA